MIIGCCWSRVLFWSCCLIVSLSLPPVRVRDYGPVKDTGGQNFSTWQTKVGSVELYTILLFRGEPQRNFT